MLAHCCRYTFGAEVTPETGMSTSRSTERCTEAIFRAAMLIGCVNEGAMSNHEGLIYVTASSRKAIAKVAHNKCLVGALQNSSHQSPVLACHM